ncbi:hypothetical protein PHMEG_00012501 [Phytophthora megakarya]|uniref:Uncharacterized protein n=1 Tax=Phytophthora megakarya TaxID=4795 RepID=A0A225WA19_9STRA|nr:hypothetical protein PHMEG_00012501 [Phytophthora megakarya]
MVAYNFIMNGMDRAEQLRSTNPIRRKERRPSMSLLTQRHRQPVLNTANKPIQDLMGEDKSVHAITPNSKQHSSGKLTCYLCALRGLSKKAVYGCTGCHHVFHVVCFTAFHYRDALTSMLLSVHSVLDAVCAAVSGDGVHTRLKENRTITYLDELRLP